MKTYRLSKTVVSVQSPNAASFLNGLTSNTPDQTKNAFLNVHGRIIATFDGLKVAEDRFLLVVETAFVEPLLAHLEPFARLSKVKLAKEDYSVYYEVSGEFHPTAGEYVIPQKAGQLVLTRRELPPTMTEAEFTLFRVKNGIPLQGVDYRDELVLNVSETEFVSFSKGCFLGQEPVAKVHNRSKPTWKLAVKYAAELDAESRDKLTSKVIDPATGKEMGFVFVSNKS